MPRSDLPFGSEFSPQQIDLATLLELAHRHAEDWHAFEFAVRDRYFAEHETSDYNKLKLANNTKLSMRAYGLIEEKDTTLTAVGQTLYELRHDAPALYETLGRHILTERLGMAFVQCIVEMQGANEPIDLRTLRHALGERGLHVPRGGKHMSTMRLWLEKAGVFSDGYRVDDQRLKAILGLGADEFSALAVLSRQQRTYLKTLANMGRRGPHSSSDIEKLATATYGETFDEKGLPKQVLYPLRDAGFITIERGTKEKGRGAKPFLVTGTQKFESAVLIPVIEQIEKDAHPELRPLLRKSLAEIRAEVKSSDKHIAGLALEALAFKLMRLIDLEYRGTRQRGVATGGAEVDVIFESTRLVFSRWQVQCKNTSRVALDDVAKEVGLTHVLKSNVIVMVTTGKVSEPAREYANRVMTDSNLCIAMIDGADLTRINTEAAAIVDVLTREARHAMDLKRS